MSYFPPSTNPDYNLAEFSKAQLNHIVAEKQEPRKEYTITKIQNDHIPMKIIHDMRIRPMTTVNLANYM